MILAYRTGGGKPEIEQNGGERHKIRSNSLFLLNV